MKRASLALAAPWLTALLLVPGLALAQPGSPSDRVTFGADAVVAAGETVRDVVTMGGDARVEGEVLGDVVTMGGDVELAPGAQVHGDVVSMGGDLRAADGAVVHGDVVGFGDVQSAGTHGGEIVSFGGPGRSHGHVGPAPRLSGLAGFLSDALSGLVRYGLLFLLGLSLMGLARERFEALQVVIVRKPARVAALGILGFLGSIAAVVVLAVTIIGIPAAIVLALGLPLAIYVGMAASASVIGAALPVEGLRRRPVLQLGAGVLSLYFASLVPFLGGLIVCAAALVGLGALFETRLARTVQLPPDPVAVGPYRTSAA